LGHKVIALGEGSEEKWKDKFDKNNIDYRSLYVERNGINPIKDFITFYELNKFMKLEKPDKVFAYHAKTIVYGSISAKLNGVTEFYTLIAGLGSIFGGKGIKNRILKIIMKIEYWIAFKFSKVVFFQNKDDRNEFVLNGLVRENKTVIINGSGVNLDKFKPTPIPTEPAFLFIGRLIKDKGIVEYLKVCEVVKQKYPKIRCLLVGPYDSNPSAIKKEELEPYIDNGIIEYFGEQMDVRPFISQCTTYVFPSYYREGTPKSILEAMASGRPIITTDAIGCRETVINDVNGFLIPVRNIEILADKMIWMIKNVEKAKKMGEESVRICIDKYNVKKVNKEIMRTMNLI
jgi:glycosyltransferase involved in cell wall biosynthesis